MRQGLGCFGALIVGVAVWGCASNRDPDKDKSNQAVPHVSENAVRAAIAAVLKVDSSTIQMDKPFSDPSLKADELDLVEIVMELEERFGVEISDAALERSAGGKLGKDLLRLTPKQLVSAIQEAPKSQSLKRKK